jgi:hypothetical protein
VTGFQTLVYTDCRPGESVTGTAGMGFRARSAGAGAAAMDLVKRNLLYEVPENWMRESRPVPDYPRSYAHIVGQMFASARGVYLGKEVSGARQGNHLTHAIVARDARSYGLVRPAQLLDAPFWVNPPGPVRDSTPLPGRLPRGPFDAHEAQAFIASEFRGAEMLMSLLTVLEQPSKGAQRVLFIARDSGEVMRWLTAATLLLPQATALRIGFKVFTVNPAFATQRVLAIHPDWNSSAATVDNDLGYQVFDLVERRSTPVTPSPRASKWVRLFLGEDPFDVVDAVELSGQGPSMSVAITAVLGHRPDPGADAEAAVEWLRTGPDLTVGVYGARVFEVLMASVDDWAQPVLDQLFPVLTERRLGDRTVGFRALLRVELRRATTSGNAGPTGRSVPADAWDTAGRLDAEQEVLGALRQAPAAYVDAVLRVATRFAVPVDYTEVTDPIELFVEAWADDPGRRYDPASWPNGAELAARLRAVLNGRLSDDLTFARIGSDWWQALPVPAIPPVDDLDVALIAARMVESPATERDRFVDDAVDRCRFNADPAAAFRRTVGAMWRRAAPRVADAQKIRRAAPKGLRFSEPDLAPWPTRLRDEPTGHPEAVAALAELQDGGLLAVDESVLRLLREQHQVDELIEQIRTADPRAAEAVKNLGHAEATALELRREATIEGLVLSPRPDLATDVVIKVPGLARDYLRKVEHISHSLGTPASILHAFYLYTAVSPPAPFDHLLDKDTRKSLENTVRKWVGRAAPYEFEPADKLARRLSGDLPDRWRSMVKSARGRRLFGGR